MARQTRSQKPTAPPAPPASGKKASTAKATPKTTAKSAGKPSGDSSTASSTPAVMNTKDLQAFKKLQAEHKRLVAQVKEKEDQGNGAVLIYTPFFY